MKLGILVTTDKHLDDIVGLTEAAVSKGHEVIIFNMDEGVRLLEKSAFTDLAAKGGVSMSFCDHSTGTENVSKDGVPENVVCGSQFNNANMHHDADKMLNL
jgi:predicted peroxiredoxin